MAGDPTRGRGKSPMRWNHLSGFQFALESVESQCLTPDAQAPLVLTLGFFV